MNDLGFLPFDADNHYYEAIDAFTRHLDPALGPRCVEWAEVNGRRYHVVGGMLSRAVTNPTFDPIAPPGAMHDYFRGNPEGKSPLEFLKARESIRPAYRQREARVEALDEFGLSSVWLFPTLGMLYEELLKHDPFAVCATYEAFNRWVDDDWGFDRGDGRIFTAPYLALADVDWACRELEWAIDHGARMIVMRAAAPTTETGVHSPFDVHFDPFWARLNEAGIPLVIHAGDTGWSSNGYAEDDFGATFSGGWKPSVKSFAIERSAADFVISSVFEKMFDRFPNLRMASVENGSTFLADVIKKLRSTDLKMPGYFTSDPVRSLQQGWWINPFWEDDVNEVVSLMGADRVIFGSDWPHIEGMPEPLDYVPELAKLTDEERRMVLLDNVVELNTPRPT
jgi:predicted TIM-barrel fold metal-dependent hydrolase